MAAAPGTPRGPLTAGRIAHRDGRRFFDPGEIALDGAASRQFEAKHPLTIRPAHRTAGDLVVFTQNLDHLANQVGITFRSPRQQRDALQYCMTGDLQALIGLGLPGEILVHAPAQQT